MDIEYRAATLSDAESILEINKVGIKTNQFKYNLTSSISDDFLVNLKKRFTEKDKSVHYYVAYDKDSANVVGLCVFYVNGQKYSHRAEIGWSVHNNFTGNGIATNLTSFVLNQLKELGIKRVEAEIAEPNIASLRIAEKLGFKIEGEKEFGMIGDDGEKINTIIVGKLLE